MARFYCNNITSNNIELTGAEASHMINVMRQKAGDHVELFDGKGTLAQATITSATKKTAQLKIESKETLPPKTTSRIIIAASIAKGQRFDWMISKCTELGTDHIAPIICHRTVKLAKGSNTMDRLEKLTISTAKQCHRLFLPTISAPQTLASSIEDLKQTYPNANIIFGGLGTGSTTVDSIETNTDIIAIVGPEGGFTNEEEDLLKENGATPIRLTNTILRTETAATTFAAILCTKRDAKEI